MLLRDWPSGTVAVTSSLNKQGYSGQLLNRYKKSRWLASPGNGALVRIGEKISYEGILYAIHNQLKLSIYPGSRTAFSLTGKAHYLELSQSRVDLFGYIHELLPTWCRNAASLKLGVIF
ncbi:hypothetical protein DSL64_28490 [Dyadobacter luteus]|uniref:Transcriptional regulator AbiEi antitoxin N-terminal domain-containing protein n=1 Tax=Dyadobacter luteus TaxID=2259619 RepID=A0A3D8Y2B6_9BACT|nr:hypothetical protein DSL64_28490 [Dyadobacter luteus]